MDAHEGDMPSPWQLARAFLPFFGGARPRAPSIFAILERTTLVASLSLSQRLSREVDLYLSPPVADFGSFEWTALERIVATGLEFGREQIGRWRDAGGWRS
jgi:predicted acylesterase/phospholipase RssA